MLQWWVLTRTTEFRLLPVVFQSMLVVLLVGPVSMTALVILRNVNVGSAIVVMVVISGEVT